MGSDGKGTDIHYKRGEFNVTFTSITNDYIMIGTNIGTLYLVYNEGTFTLRGQEAFDVSLTKGDFLSMFKIAGVETDGNGDDDGDSDDVIEEAPAYLTEEYLVGAWTGTETDWERNTYTITIFVNNNKHYF